jgi:flavodoxin I
MTKIGLFYGSSTGNTEYVAYEIKAEFDKYCQVAVEIFNIGSTSVDQFLSYEYLVLGIPTWNTGQLQDDWEIFLEKLDGVDMTGKQVAIFGLGDQNGYGYNFLDAVGILADALFDMNADIYGVWSVDGYEFEESLAQEGEYFLGLGVDQDGQPNLTDDRIVTWVKVVLADFGL